MSYKIPDTRALARTEKVRRYQRITRFLFIAAALGALSSGVGLYIDHDATKATGGSILFACLAWQAVRNPEMDPLLGDHMTSIGSVVDWDDND